MVDDRDEQKGAVVIDVEIPSDGNIRERGGGTSSGEQLEQMWIVEKSRLAKEEH